MALALVPGIQMDSFGALSPRHGSPRSWRRCCRGSLPPEPTRRSPATLVRRGRRVGRQLADPEVDGVALRAARRRAVPGAAVGGAVRGRADHPPVAARRVAPPARSGRRRCPAPRRPASSASCTAPSTGCPPSGGTTASWAGCWSPTGRRTPRVIEAARERRAGPAGRRRGLDVEPLHRRRPPLGDDDEPAVGRQRGITADPAGGGVVPAHAERLRPQLHPHVRRDRQGALAGPRQGGATFDRGCIAAGRSRSCGRSPTACCATSTPRWSPRRCCRGTRSIYVDYVDYDEIAHHAGHVPAGVAGGAGGRRRVLRSLEHGRERGAAAILDRAGLRPRPVAGRRLR